MATIKISDLRSNLSVSPGCQEEFIEVVNNAIARALDARQLQDIRGGFQPSTTKVTPVPIFVGIMVS